MAAVAPVQADTYAASVTATSSGGAGGRASGRNDSMNESKGKSGAADRISAFGRSRLETPPEDFVNKWRSDASELTAVKPMTPQGPDDGLFVIINRGEDGFGALATVRVRGKSKKICRRSLFFLSLDNWFRQQVLLFVEWRWFDRFILLCIVINSILLGVYQHRAQKGIDDHYALNEFIDNTADHILWGIFTAESVLKIIGWGFILSKKTYLRDPWNTLDFVVVVSGLIERAGAGGSLNFLRLFRLLRPLRSLNAVPQMKILVNTALSSILKLGNVVILGAFLFMVFGIVGVSLMHGIFYRQCYTTRNPVLLGGCWSWNTTADNERLCGGNYNCEAGGFCGGHVADPDKSIRPIFAGGRRGLPWCAGSEPAKLYPETDFVHFDHIGAALLTIFQVMTLEGWTDLMYMVEDAFNPWFAILFFISIVILTNFFMLNVALAVVDEVQDKFREDQEKAEEQEHLKNAEDGPERRISKYSLSLDEPELWCNCWLVAKCEALSRNEIFMNFILLIIFGNVINMCLQWFSLSDAFGYGGLAKAINILEITFLGIFIVEMLIMLIGLGPKGYVMNPITCFDGFVVVISIIELIINETGDGSGGGLSALRTFRLFRVMNKLATKWTKLKVLLKAMLHTGAALNYWLILFGLVMYIFTLMWMSVFATQFHFEDADSLDPLYPRLEHGQEWCPGTDDGRSWHYRQDCIPRAHFDTFTWGFVTVFQVMTGENWNTIMYAGMRASERWEGTVVPPTFLSALLFVIMILFGQTLFLSLFLSMLISKFDTVQDQFEEEERMKKSATHRRGSGQAVMHVATFINRLKVISDKNTNVEVMPKEVEPIEVGAEPEPGEEAGSQVQTSVDKFVSVSVHSPERAPLDEDGGQPQPQEPQKLESPKDAAVSVSEIPIPGQMPGSPSGADSLTPPCPTPKAHIQYAESEGEGPGEAEPAKQELKQIPTKKRYPQGYALLLFSESNPIRMGARWLLTKKVSIGGNNIQIFDNVVLVCILLSTLCMMADTPLSDPRHSLTQALRTADKVFAVIFMAEMTIKLVALGLWREGPSSYLRSGWNWLDGIVVMVSVVDFATGGEGPGFLRVLRILRTFRPLRVISRNEGLRVVVQTLFQSMGDLFGLVIVSSLFLLIFALVFLMYLKGGLYYCEPGSDPIRFLKGDPSGIGDNFVTPMCLGSGAAGVPMSLPYGAINSTSDDWTTASASCQTPLSLQWRRASADTPICLARCDPSLDSHPGIEHLCHRRYVLTEELPSLCPSDPNRTLRFSTEAQEGVGNQYISDMQRTLTLPCGGHAVDSATGQVSASGSAFSCKENFCRNVGPASESCVAECGNHEYFCRDVCKGTGSGTPECQACRGECESACMCESFCTPLIKDAALCHEQGGSWAPVLSQDFNNIVNAMLTLFEISTTEGWVDVMYAASDFTDVYRQPVRDSNHGPYVFLFPLWILLSFMFLINLAVGVIVDNFENAMQEKENQKSDLLTESQRRWMRSRKTLAGRAFIFDLTNLHLLPPVRRKVYAIISSKVFEQIIMTAIVSNTVIMALTIFPAPEEWWTRFQEYANYVFAGIYTIEAVLKLFALRCSYWKDRWNQFDFACVVATWVGIGLNLIGAEVGSVTSVIRTFRIARLFRLLRFLKELNRLFMCLLSSIPKLYNVMMILCLFLVLFSILGMSLFGTAKFPTDGTLNEHGNFQTFWRGFVTLFRASTGEAWNEIMHNLAKDEEAYFREGDWCTPQNLFKSRHPDAFAVLEEKCLIATPNACPGSWNPLPAIFWVSYTLLITYMIMNLLVAVILKGYEEGKQDIETDNIDLCIETWKKYDPDHKMVISLPSALRFLHEVMALSAADKAGALPLMDGNSMSDISRNVDFRALSRFARLAVEMNVMQDQAPSKATLQSEVSFMSASRQALRLISMKGLSIADLEEIEAVDDHISNKKEVAKLQRIERKSTMESCAQDILPNLAARKIQQRFRERRASTGNSSAGSAACVTGVLSGQKEPRFSSEKEPRFSSEKEPRFSSEKEPRFSEKEPRFSSENSEKQKVADSASNLRGAAAGDQEKPSPADPVSTGAVQDVLMVPPRAG